MEQKEFVSTGRVGVSSCETYKSTWDSSKIETGVYSLNLFFLKSVSIDLTINYLINLFVLFKEQLAW